MGSGMSSTNSRKWGKKKRELPPHAESSRVLFLLYLIHRTWNVVVEHVDNKSARWRGSGTMPSSVGRRFDSVSLEESEPGSCYSTCSCSYCRLRDCAHDCVSELTLQDGMANTGGWSEEPVSKDKQRPPIYNPEDYATSLKKWGKKTGASSLYETDPGQDPNKARTLPNQSSKDFRNPCLSLGEEMSLRQFGTPSELLTKLRADLRLSFPSFVQEFACEPLDGVTLLLELLRNVQLSQSGDGARGPPAVRRRPLLDELACLQCLWSCCSRYPDCVRRLVAGSNGIYTLTVCIMSTVNKSRVLALQLLTKACYPPADGHNMVSEALSTLRLRYGEPVRFRFLVGMLQSVSGGGTAAGAGGAGELQSAGLAFLNALLRSAPAPQRRLYLQAELEQAGFDIVTLKKMMSKLPQPNDQVTKEIEDYEKQLIDIDSLSEKAHEAQKEKDDLRNKLDLLEKRVKILQEEKGILLSLEKCLKEKCCELQEEVSSLRSEHGNSNRKKSFGMKKKNSLHNSRDESSPPEDEGISSSERSLSPEGDPQRESMIYEVFNVKNETYDLMRNKRTYNNKKFDPKKMDKKSSDEEDETTIDEVIQELRNIVNHAESEQYAKERIAFGDEKSSRCNQTSEINVSVKGIECQKHRDIDQDDSITSTRHSIQITSSNEFLDETNDEEQEEAEIVPSRILPHPPRKAKSLVHLCIPQVNKGLLYNKPPPDLYEENFYSSDEGSDSLLSASRYQNITNNNSVSGFDFHQRRAMFAAAEKEREDARGKRSRTRSRDENRRNSVKRSESFQTSEKGTRQREYIDSMFYSENQTLEQTSPLQRSNSKGNRVDEIVSLIESKKLTKSLDRIDEGLNSMVDIVLLSEPKKPSWPYERRQRSCSRTNSDTGKETPLVPVTRSNSKLANFSQKYEKVNTKGSEETSKNDQKFFSPHMKMSNSGSYDNASYTNPSFIVKRGHSNAGFYSGPHILRDAPASMTSLVMTGTHSHSDLKRNLSPMSSTFGAHKVTDMPSGLY